MKIALIHDQVTENVGSEITFREIIDLYEGTIFSSVVNWERIKWLADREVKTTLVQKLPLGTTKHYLYAPILPDLYRRLDFSDYDVLLSDSHSFAHQVRKWPGALHVCYYHTPARSLWLPEIDNRASSGKLAWLKKMIAKRLKRLDLEASKNPDFLLANSQTTADRLQKFYGRTVERIIYPPVDTQSWTDVKRESDDMGLLFWGRLIPYKRIDLAIEAARITGEKLQISGMGPYEEQLKAQAAGMSNVIFHGRLPDADLKALMARCRAVVFPCYEDFGIVPVEAMAAGLPVIAYGVGGASETVTPEFGEQFMEQTPEALADAIVRSRSKSFDGEKLQAHALKFDREIFRTQYKETVDSLIQRHRDSR